MISFPLRLRGPVRGGASSPAGPDGALLTKVSGRNPHPETPRFPGLRLGSMVIVPGGGVLSGSGYCPGAGLFSIRPQMCLPTELRPHSIILASCKPGRKQVESMSKASCELA